jgi:hypothetical protein
LVVELKEACDLVERVAVAEQLPGGPHVRDGGVGECRKVRGEVAAEFVQRGRQ